LRLFAAIALCLATAGATCQKPAKALAVEAPTVSADSLPDSPSQVLLLAAVESASPAYSSSSGATDLYDYSLYPTGQQQGGTGSKKSVDHPIAPPVHVDLDENGDPIDLDRQEPRRILGFMPNFRTVSAGSKPHPPGWNYNFKVATRQAFDYSSFVFLGLTSISAEGLDEHPALGKGFKGLYEYSWRGFLDKTDGTYLGGWLLPSLLHEDTRFYPLGHGHSIPTRALYVISRQAVTRTYGGHQTLNIAGLGGKVLTQYISRSYYPTGTSDFAVLAEKFAYSAMRDVIFSSIREFYPDIAAHYIRRHREKLYREQAALQSTLPTSTP
jgi:hypothetical protein